jgi:hypothetical protein
MPATVRYSCSWTPYGLTIPFERVVHVLKFRDKAGYSQLLQPKTELLMNFSYEAVRRIAGVVRSDRTTRRSRHSSNL